jgi:hypothetical protein
LAILKGNTMPNPSIKVTADLFASNPTAVARMAAYGITPEYLAVALNNSLNELAHDPAARDRLFATTLAPFGVFTSGIKGFDEGSESMLRNMGNREATYREAQRLSDESRKTGHYFSPEVITKLRDTMAQSSLQQGFAAKFRDREDTHRDHFAEARAHVPKREDMARSREDERDLRSALGAAIASTSHDRNEVQIHDDERRSLRETLSDSFDAAAVVEYDRDPLQDERLLSMSDAI